MSDKPLHQTTAFEKIEAGLKDAAEGRFTVMDNVSQTTLPQLPEWCFQPEDDTPGLFLQLETREQRMAIMEALGAPLWMLLKEGLRR